VVVLEEAAEVYPVLGLRGDPVLISRKGSRRNGSLIYEWVDSELAGDETRLAGGKTWTTLAWRAG
jgi:hypothetical protein